MVVHTEGRSWHNQRIFYSGLVFVSVVICGFLIYQQYDPVHFGRPPLYVRSMSDQALMDCLTNGVWRKDTSRNTSHLEKRLDHFFRVARDKYRLPHPLQRSDKLCGNVSFADKGQLSRFRAVCDPSYATPCCFHGRCRNLSVEQCACPDCYDLRRAFHGEVARWTGIDSRCSLNNYTSQAACGILRNKAVVFIGDSFMRQMFMGLQILLTNNDVDSCMKAQMKPDTAKYCKWMFMFTRECRYYVPKKDILCRGSVTIYLYEYYDPGSLDIIRIVQKHFGSRSTLFVIGIGLHYNLNPDFVIRDVARPVTNIIRDNPNLIWVLPHSLGVLKSPSLPKQSNPRALRYNARLREYLGARGVRLMDAFNLTRKLASYDGSHYPKAANLLKDGRPPVFYLVLPDRAGTTYEDTQQAPSPSHIKLTPGQPVAVLIPILMVRRHSFISHLPQC